MIKGHSIIELKNVNTGKVEHYEDDNIVTNGVAKYLEDLGMFNANPLLSDPIIKANPIERMFGGLLLFDSTITESADRYTCPSGVKMIGNGAYNVTYDGDNNLTELGSWNSTESGWMSDGSYKMVWDFATTQANGTINCACLTSDNHGYIGEGNSTSESTVVLANRRTDYERTGSPYYFFPSTVLQEKFDKSFLVHASRTNGTMTFIKRSSLIYTSATASEHMSSTGKLILQTYQMPLSEFDLRESFPYNNNGGANYIPVSEVEVNIPQAFLTMLGTKTPLHYIRHGKNYYMISADASGSPSGWREYVTLNTNTINIVKIAPDNTVTSYTATIPSAYHYIDLHNVGFSDEGQICMPIYAVINNVGVWSIWFQDMTNQADEDIIEGVNYLLGRQTGFISNYTDDGIMMMGSENGYVYKVDLNERTVYPTNQASSLVAYSALDDNRLIWNSQAVGPDLHRAQNYLATINNLQTAVTKTAEKTMKVTYVLSFDDGE